jgi:tripartite-type tricarboxylate transporter receptor subunit TctC
MVLSNVLPHVKTGKVHALAVIENHRADASPETPTVAEAGLAGFAVPDTWIGVLGPAGMPAAITSRLQSELAAATVVPEVRSKLEAAGFQVKVTSSREFAEQLVTGIETYRGIVNAAKIRLE